MPATDPETNDLPASGWQLEEVPCDYCGSGDAEVLWTGRDRLHGLPGTFHVVACRQCGLARTNPRPTLASLPAAYPAEYGPHQDSAARARPPRGLLRWALVNFRGYPLGRRAPAAIRRLLAPVAAVALRRRRVLGYVPFTGRGRLLDYGCGAGRYVARMIAAGWQAEGLDLSPNAVQAGRRAGLTVHQGALPGTTLPPESFDAVTMWQVIEHVPSPLATLKAAADLLRPGGLVLIACPRIDSLPARWFGAKWHDLDLPRHLTHFCPTTLARHLQAAGLRVERLWSCRRPSGLRRSFAYLAAETHSPLHRRLSRSRALVGLLSLAAALARRPAQMLCLARKGP